MPDSKKNIYKCCVLFVIFHTDTPQINFGIITLCIFWFQFFQFQAEPIWFFMTYLLLQLYLKPFKLFIQELLDMTRDSNILFYDWNCHTQ